MRPSSNAAQAGRRASVVVAVLVAACGGGSNDSEVLGTATDDAGLTAYCAGLATCCPSLPMEVVRSCEQLAAQAGAAECSRELTALAAGGRCGPAGSPPDAGLADDATLHETAVASDASAAGADAAVACILLDACCSSAALPSDEVASCMSIQGAGSESQCASLFGDLTASSSCSGASVGAGGACPDLQACCASSAFPPQFLTTCQGAVAAGENASCASDLASFVPAGYCPGVVTTSDGGHAPDPDCTMLAMCCNEITFPMSTLSTCQEVAAANAGGTCSSAYDSYSALGYCE